MRTLVFSGLAAMLMVASSACAQDTEAETRDGKPQRESWYEPVAVKVDPLQVHMQKAAIRSMHRRARIASMNWYGMSVGRPIASATPHTALYSPQWQMPGGRPYAWYPRSRASAVYIYR